MDNMHKVLKIIEYGSANFILRVERKNLKFNPGQFFSIGIPGLLINREYSVSSGIDADYMDFLIREIKDGTLSKKLKTLKMNDQIKILGPYGEFYLKEFDINKEYIFFASGSGLAPFLSIIKSYQNLNFHIFHGIRLFEDIYTEYKINNYNVFISQDNIEEKKYESMKIYKGRITNNFDKIDKFINKNKIYFMCGNSSMMNDIYNYLEINKIKNNNIYSELFF
jgi:ferredoxin/flavodoxin---NADP+ reductase